MNAMVETGVLRRWSIGGEMILAMHLLMHFMNACCANERLVVLRIGNTFISNVFFPCVGTSDREAILKKWCLEIGEWLDRYGQCAYITTLSVQLYARVQSVNLSLNINCSC
jgi:hypothetical protein